MSKELEKLQVEQLQLDIETKRRDLRLFPWLLAGNIFVKVTTIIFALIGLVSALGGKS